MRAVEVLEVLEVVEVVEVVEGQVRLEMLEVSRPGYEAGWVPGVAVPGSVAPGRE